MLRLAQYVRFPRMTTGTIVVIVAAVTAALAFFAAYNSLVGRRNGAQNAFGSVDVMLKKRFDLIPSLVATVKQYASHEQETLTRLTDLRSRVGQGGAGAPTRNERVVLENQVSQALARVLVVAENYPELRASENFQQLQRALNEVEEQLSASRRAYNAAVTDYNNAVEMVPTNIVASMFSHKRMEVFTLPESERRAPDVAAMFRS